MIISPLKLTTAIISLTKRRPLIFITNRNIMHYNTLKISLLYLKMYQCFTNKKLLHTGFMIYFFPTSRYISSISNMYLIILFCDAIYFLLSGKVYKTSETPFFVLPSFDAQKVYFHTQKSSI